jgi:hypothetical protein
MWIGHASASHGEDGSALRAGRDLQVFATIEGWDFDGRTKCGLAKRDGPLQDQILAIPFEERVRFDMDEAISITARTAIGAWLSFSLQTHSHSIIDTRRDPDFEFDREWL